MKYGILTTLVVVSFFSCKEDPVLTDIIQFPRISAINTEADEDPGFAEATVVLSWPYNNEVSVDFTVRQINLDSVPNQAEANVDFTPQSGKLVFPAGETKATVQVELASDVLPEADEVFEINISNARLGEIIKSSGIITLKNDDAGFFVDNTGFDAPTSYQGYNLVWEDDFSAGEIDGSVWTHELGGNGWGNNELQVYTDKPGNSFQAGGYLVIEAREEPAGSGNYTSARMITKDKQEFQYGRIDIRARLPIGKGMWPALWMLGANFNEVGWPKCGEIDIMELVGNQPSIIHGTAHYGENNADHQFKGSSNFLVGSTFDDEFHVFSIIWKENSIQWLRDGVQYFSLTPANISPAAWPFNNPSFFIFNVAVGGDWPGSPDSSTAFPARMYVDYVRVYQQ
jgi:beta-glucanase (GH16 family)